jgi:aspartyl protease family protein
MSDAHGSSSGAMLRRALLLTTGCSAAAFLVPRWIGASGDTTGSGAETAQSEPARQRPTVRPAEKPAADDEPQTIFDNNEIVFRAGRNNQFFVRAAINGIEIPFIIDTGASYVALRLEDAEKIGLSANSLQWNIRVNTANGNSYAAAATLGSVRLDRAVAYNVPALVMQPNSSDVSLLGMTFLSRLKSWRIHDGLLSIRY